MKEKKKIRLRGTIGKRNHSLKIPWLDILRHSSWTSKNSRTLLIWKTERVFILYRQNLKVRLGKETEDFMRVVYGKTLVLSCRLVCRICLRTNEGWWPWPCSLGTKRICATIVGNRWIENWWERNGFLVQVIHKSKGQYWFQQFMLYKLQRESRPREMSHVLQTCCEGLVRLPLNLCIY